MGMERAGKNNECEVNNSPAARFRRPVEAVVPELFVKARNGVCPRSCCPIPFEAFEKLNRLPKQVVPVSIVGVNVPPFDAPN